MRFRLPVAVVLAVVASISAAFADSPSFTKVNPGTFDPAKTFLVQAAWIDGIGCPTGAKIATYPAKTPTGTTTDPACLTGDSADKHNQGLLLAKTGPTSNNAAGVADLKNVKGITLTELGYDIRKQPTAGSAFGSHCGAGAPRFDVETTDGFWAVGCNSPPADTQVPGDGFTRLRWGPSPALSGYKDNVTLSPITGTVTRIQIVFDEGTDAFGGPDKFGLAVLDNIDVNTKLVGQGPTSSSDEHDRPKGSKDKD